jgi:glycosyltransferase involved in cell wall biosynthesis
VTVTRGRRLPGLLASRRQPKKQESDELVREVIFSHVVLSSPSLSAQFGVEGNELMANFMRKFPPCTSARRIRPGAAQEQGPTRSNGDRSMRRLTNLADVTALIKTFLRDEYLFTCVSSLRLHYPNIRIIVADDGYCSDEKEARLKDAGVSKYIALPWNRGVSRGRNRLIDACETPYFLVGDDDFYYSEETRLGDMLRMMEIADLAGGALQYLDTLQHYEATLEWVPESKGLIHHEISRDYQAYDGIQYGEADLTFNFFVAKTDLAREIRWEDSIQVIFEHEDFFMAGHQRGMRVVYCPNSVVTHRKIELPTTAEYENIRWNRQDKDKFLKKWDLNFVQDVQGRRLTCNNPVVI